MDKQRRYATSVQNLKVVELGSVLAIPAVGMFFAELGAQVIKIENKQTGGDITRSWKLPTEDTQHNTSAYFYSVNYHKTHLLLDLSNVQERSQVLTLIKEADIVLSNFKPSSAERIGMDYPSLQRLNPALIYAQLYGFSAHDDTPALDVVLQAEAGFLYMTGSPKQPPAKMPVALIDLLAAHQLKEGILLALLQRTHTGKGALVSTSLYESAVASLANQASNWLMCGHIPERIGSAHPNIMPYGDVYTTLDAKEIVLACATENHWQRLCEVLGLSDLTQQKAYRNNTSRVKNRATLVATLQARIQHFTAEQLSGLLQAANIPFGIVRSLPEVFDNPSAKAMILQEHHANGSVSKRVATVAFSIEHWAETPPPS